MPPAGYQKRLVIVDWTDGDVADSDEIFVFAFSDEEAERIARKRWRMTIGAEWPNCRLNRTYVMSKERLQGYC